MWLSEHVVSVDARPLNPAEENLVEIPAVIIPNHAPATNKINGLAAPPKAEFSRCAVNVPKKPEGRRFKSFRGYQLD